MTLSNTTFVGALFDGRYVYFIPNGVGGTDDGYLIQYDTTLPFGDMASYTRMWVRYGGLGGSNATYAGGVFDGQYVYLVPASGSRYASTIARPLSSRAAITDRSTEAWDERRCSNVQRDVRFVAWIRPHSASSHVTKRISSLTPWRISSVSSMSSLS